MFSKEQIEALFILIDKGVITLDEVRDNLRNKLVEVGVLTPPPPPAPEVPTEPVPPAPEGAPVEGQPVA